MGRIMMTIRTSDQMVHIMFFSHDTIRCFRYIHTSISFKMFFFYVMRLVLFYIKHFWADFRT